MHVRLSEPSISSFCQAFNISIVTHTIPHGRQQPQQQRRSKLSPCHDCRMMMWHQHISATSPSTLDRHMVPPPSRSSWRSRSHISIDAAATSSSANGASLENDCEARERERSTTPMAAIKTLKQQQVERAEQAERRRGVGGGRGKAERESRRYKAPMRGKSRGPRQVSRSDWARDVNGGLLAALAAATWQQGVLGGAKAVGSTIGDVVRKGGVALLEPRPVGFPPGPEGDMALTMAADPLRCIAELAKEFGGAVGMKMAGERVVLLSDPLLAREVLKTQSNIFIKSGTAFFPGSSLAGNGLLVSDGDIWQRQRRLSNPAFRKSAVNSYAEAMVEVTRALLDQKWGSAGIIRDVYADFNDLTMRVVATSLFGGGFVDDVASAGASEVGPAITTAFQHFNTRATSMFIVPEWVPTPDNIQYNAAVIKLDRVVYRLIAERRAEMRQLATAGGSPRRDLLTKLLETTDDDGSGMDDIALRDELMTLLVAGQETSAILLSWISVMLCQHPEVQERLAEEVRQVAGNRPLTHSDIRKLPFLEAVIYETMRLLPPAYLVGRCASQATTLGGLWDIPQGTTILVSPYLLHRDPRHWPRAEEFDPDRWMPGGDSAGPKENDCYMPFGGGPRNCIGMGFAMMEVSLVVASILQRYKLSLPKAEEAPTPRAMITLRPAGRVDIKLTLRP